ncbi:Asp23/Gls24 family envelope stress response protein [Veillonella sp. YH-vei2232]|jgi:uncharacterized alkaline shock family protein YloU|uniref:Asp23/Gls24 family envelope stress response protein n=1 Tax=Veillonella absiana TaxID=3079305 RepID=A0ABU3ZAJ1_9FIRM|nr:MULTISPECIES: Asp23/Gls24 family envelope stress response protein [unclassified Veillonella]NCB95551.1 Asp23/Gls24 family envelope stress response protein [Negativicutes bacterium]MBK7921255.1 Asp23/Gls24 family envelope stress response protein [Veillonella sp.]MBP6923277.1 Asp23/Gls24 family envelope stress response protein [Veillonella sp.]MBP8617131.1 Asp23/Gls24 family envelope stress response protein [Veillonella sp.]MBP9551067.1 Asp23/Gls24 family envelope stress response protein [Vei
MDTESNTKFQYGLDMATVEIADSVVLEVATKVVQNVPGVHALSPRFYDEIVDGIVNRFGQKTLPGINIKHRKGFLEINLYVRVYYGQNIVALAELLQQEIRENLKNMLDLYNVKVDVHIEGVEPINTKEISSNGSNKTE